MVGWLRGQYARKGIILLEVAKSVQRSHILECNHRYLLDIAREPGGNLGLSNFERRYLWGHSPHYLFFKDIHIWTYMDLKYNDKLTPKDISNINGFYNSQHPKPKKILSKPVQPVLTPEPLKNSMDVLDMPMCTIRELSQYLKVSILTLKRWERRGKIKSIRINSRGDRRYLKEEIQRFIGGI